MAAASALVSEDSLLCPVCLSVFTKPVSIPCGHNFCMNCITDYWSTLSVLQCPLCKETFYTRPLLRVNPVIAEMAEKVKKSLQEMLSSAERAGHEDVLCSMCAGSKVKALKSCLMCLVSYCQTHLEPHQRISALKKHKLIDPVKNLESRICRDHGEPLELICRLDQMFLCRSCKCSDHKTHEAVSLEDEAEMRKSQLRLENNSMDQMIQEREQKIQELQQSVKTSRSKAEEALSYSRKVMTALVQHIKTEFTRLSEAIETKQEINETEAESFIDELQAEITHMKKKKLQFHEASLIRDPFSFLENVLPLTYNKPQLQDWSAVTVTSDQFMIQETLAELETAVREEVSTLYDVNFRDGKEQRISLISSPHEDIISDSFLIRSGPPAVYQLRPKKQKTGTLTRITVGEKRPNKTNRTILLVGETGAGKYTLINAMLNYTMGVKWEEEVWFMIAEEERRSQTSDVIVYEIFGFEDATLPYSLTIINTPGYGDTRASDYDDIISHRLLDLFQSEDGVREVHAVGLVMKASVNRLSEPLRYVLDSVMSLFGKNLEKNIVALITHSDGSRPKNPLQVLEAANIKCAKNEKNQPVYFLFNNCQLEERMEENTNFRNSWELTQTNMDHLTDLLGKSNPQKLVKTTEVLNERIRLKACIQNLEDRIELADLKQTEIRQIREALKQTNHRNKIEIEKILSLLENLEKEMEVLTAEKQKWLSDSYQHAVRLQEIALKADSASTVVHLDFLIEKMKEEGDTEKVQKLEEMRREDGGTEEAVQA
ncbi:uncharacterized protein LOC120725888 [Simochromis diagramma]|uniref:uncharacterized protein LOC120725888 n=1 Tax=Simochromis diagramma TaxID=43689 RepID=UPI001A7E9C64|nr:uncharacterized protein LOC120725888 [Simochromis diagramma]XP_039874904.1 uncharacterized protein LOC120725888 [Simochromis diagramma]